jgi:hypothetical protein
MPIEGNPFYLRTAAGTDGVGYNTLDDAKAALRTLIALETERGSRVEEQKDGRWISHQEPTGSVAMWIETEYGATIPLR